MPRIYCSNQNLIKKWPARQADMDKTGICMRRLIRRSATGPVDDQMHDLFIWKMATEVKESLSTILY